MIKLLEKNEEDLSKLLNKNIDFDGKKEEVRLFFQTLHFTLDRSYPNSMKPITYFMTCISAGNMRTALEMFNHFLSSGNTKMAEIISKVTKGEYYHIHEYQFLKSVILSDHKYYSQEKSNIMNIFDFNTELYASHFIHLRILNYAYINKDNQTSKGRGFIQINKLITEAGELFIPTEAIQESLKILLIHNLIIADTQSKTQFENATHFKITSTGTYYLTQLVKQFIYLDLIQFDTPVADVNLVKRLRAQIDEEYMDRRIDRCYAFIEYLCEAEKIEFEEHPEYKNSELTSRLFMPDIISIYLQETAIILDKVRRKRANMSKN